VEFTNAFHIERASRPWSFERAQIEFCAGLCVKDQRAIMSYGILDKHARLMVIPTETINRMLRPTLIPRWVARLARFKSAFKSALKSALARRGLHE